MLHITGYLSESVIFIVSKGGWHEEFSVTYFNTDIIRVLLV